jgi:hypothetical protein
MDLKKFNWNTSYKTIIERVLHRGSSKEWEEMIKLYGRENVVHALENEITYLSETTMEAVCDYFQLTKEKLKCYTKKHSNQGHWI